MLPVSDRDHRTDSVHWPPTSAVGHARASVRTAVIKREGFSSTLPRVVIVTASPVATEKPRDRRGRTTRMLMDEPDIAQGREGVNPARSTLAAPVARGSNRCDLHSRWRRGRDGNRPPLLGQTISGSAIPIWTLAPKGAAVCMMTVEQSKQGSPAGERLRLAVVVLAGEGARKGSIADPAPTFGVWTNACCFGPLAMNPPRPLHSDLTSGSGWVSSVHSWVSDTAMAGYGVMMRPPQQLFHPNSIREKRSLCDDRGGGLCLRAPPHPQYRMGRAGLVDTSPARTFCRTTSNNREGTAA